MAQMYAEEKRKQSSGTPSNAPKKNLVFFAYPYAPRLPRADYDQVVKNLEASLPVRIWYFDNEVEEEMMRKIWRAILRCSLAIFDISDGNPNVAVELGLALAEGKPSLTLLMRGADNPLGRADLGYSERVEYSSAAELETQLRRLLSQHCAAIKVIAEIAETVAARNNVATEAQIESRLLKLLNEVFKKKRITMVVARELMEDDGLGTAAIKALKARHVLDQAGAARGRGAHYVFSEEWVGQTFSRS
jgi:nucleoside 2-deoxyribosyltransferase